MVHWADEALEPQLQQEWAIERLFPIGGVGLVVGPAGSKKTYALVDAAVCIALGRPWLNLATMRGPVLLVDEESGRGRLNRRLGEVMRGREASESLPIAYTTLQGINIRDPADVDRLDLLFAEIRPVLVIFDALADVTPGADEDSVKDMIPAFLAVRGLADRHQTAIVIIHHANRAEGSPQW